MCAGVVWLYVAFVGVGFRGFKGRERKLEALENRSLGRVGVIEEGVRHFPAGGIFRDF